jgi:hypothetical protein
MVLLDNVDDAGIQPVLQCEIHALFDVGDDDERAHRRCEVVVRIFFSDHVFREVPGSNQLADIVKVSARAGHRAICADTIGRDLRQVRHDLAVVPPGALRLKRSKSGWLWSAISNRDISVVIWKNPSSIGNAPPTIMPEMRPERITITDCLRNKAQSATPTGSQGTVIMPNHIPRTQVASPM